MMKHVFRTLMLSALLIVAACSNDTEEMLFLGNSHHYAEEDTPGEVNFPLVRYKSRSESHKPSGSFTCYGFAGLYLVNLTIYWEDGDFNFEDYVFADGYVSSGDLYAEIHNGSCVNVNFNGMNHSFTATCHIPFGSGVNYVIATISFNGSTNIGSVTIAGNTVYSD